MTFPSDSTKLSDARVLAELAEDCFAAARFCPSEAEIGEEYAAAARAFADQSSPRHLPGQLFHQTAPPPTSHKVVQSPPPDALRTPAEAARKRKPTLASVAKQASKASIEVARYEVKSDGTVVVVIGAPGAADATDVNPWDEVLIDAADQKRPS